MQYLLWWLEFLILMAAFGAIGWFVLKAVDKLSERREKRQQRHKDELKEAYCIGLKTGWSIGYMDGRGDSNNKCSLEVAEKVMKEKCPLAPLFIAQEMIDRGFY